MSSSVLQVIQFLVAPVVMISACGLLCLALYNRMALVIARARVFNKERLELQARVAVASSDDPALPQQRHRIAVLEQQVVQILRRSHLVRCSLILLLITVLCMLFCSLALGASLFGQAWESVALILFVAGVVSEICGISTAIYELVHALETVTLESIEIDPAESSHGAD